MATELRPTESGEQRPSLDQEEMLAKLKVDLCTLADRAFPALVEGVARTDGTEGAQIKIACGYKAGGAKSKSRIEVTAKIDIPVGGFSHEVGLIEVDGETQMRMFED